MEFTTSGKISEDQKTKLLKRAIQQTPEETVAAKKCKISQTFQIFNCSKVDSLQHYSDDFDSWEEAITAITDDEEIIGHYVFGNPLNPLNNGSGDSKDLHHRFIVLDLQNKSDPTRTCAVSFEKTTR
jgi:hypothetical protein